MAGEQLTREVKFYPAWDRRSTDPSKDYGIGCVQVKFLLKGKKGAVQFALLSGWYLPHIQRKHGPQAPMPVDLGYHSLVPMYDEHSPMIECACLDGRTCYYDGSTLNAEPVLKRLLQEGDSGVWDALEKYYAEVFVFVEGDSTDA